MVNILQPPGVPHQLLRDLVRGAHAADPDDVPGDADQTLALLFLRHLQVITRERLTKYNSVKIRRAVLCKTLFSNLSTEFFASFCVIKCDTYCGAKY